MRIDRDLGHHLDSLDFAWEALACPEIVNSAGGEHVTSWSVRKLSRAETLTLLNFPRQSGKGNKHTGPSTFPLPRGTLEGRPTMAPNMSLHSVIAVLILSTDSTADPRIFGSRIKSATLILTLTDPR